MAYDHEPDLDNMRNIVMEKESFLRLNAHIIDESKPDLKYFVDDAQFIHPMRKNLADLSINIRPSEAANTIPEDADEVLIITI